jgi:hypothetical protein
MMQIFKNLAIGDCFQSSKYAGFKVSYNKAVMTDPLIWTAPARPYNKVRRHQPYERLKFLHGFDEERLARLEFQSFLTCNGLWKAVRLSIAFK